MPDGGYLSNYYTKINFAKAPNNRNLFLILDSDNYELFEFIKMSQNIYFFFI